MSAPSTLIAPRCTFCEDDEVGGQGPGAPLQPHLLTPVTRPADPQGAARVVVDLDLGGQGGDGLLVHPAQVGALELPVGEGAAVDAGPFVQRGALADGPGHVHRLVGEHGDVLGVRVHPQQRRLRGPPDASGARWMGVDEVEVETRTGVQLGRVGGDPLDQTGPPRPGSDDHQGVPHRVRSEPRA
jgi:hypothetical protein